MRRIIFLASFALTAAVGNGDEDAVQALCEGYFSFKLSRYPLYFSEAGFHQHDDEMPDHSPAGHKKFAIMCQDFRDRAGKLLQGERG